ncbi:hypothetical protein PX52LOC_07683 [Limnoglobus roseus]|uniref:Uncharacterized protein n=1 Tax=Limnoglobus roseus TaxID=2598579 RepID=A0A5C1AUV1_9BACT|nr:hypothetical protein PX52LOC_07683 [Limnoglobus roseus]
MTTSIRRDTPRLEPPRGCRPGTATRRGSPRPSAASPRPAAPRSGHDQQPRVQKPGTECNVQVGRVRIDYGDQGRRPLDAGLPQHVVLGRVALHPQAVPVSAGRRAGRLLTRATSPSNHPRFPPLGEVGQVLRRGARGRYRRGHGGLGLAGHGGLPSPMRGIGGFRRDSFGRFSPNPPGRRVPAGRGGGRGPWRRRRPPPTGPGPRRRRPPVGPR